MLPARPDDRVDLSLAAQYAFGEGIPQALRWFKQQETPLFQGQASEIASAISQMAQEKPAHRAELLQQAGYFENHKHRMNYLELRTEGWVIGSGMVESAGKRFKDRFTKAGMRWSRDGAERLLPFRGAVMSDHFDERWQTAYNSPKIGLKLNRGNISAATHLISMAIKLCLLAH